MHILLVEDDTMLAEAMSAGLALAGCDVAWVVDGLAAQAALDGHAYDAVLLDLGLPQRSGFELLAQLRRAYDTTPVIVVTACDQLSDRLRALDGGADDFVLKPFPMEELLARLRAVVRRAQGRVSPLLHCEDVTLDPARREVRRGEAPVHLSLHEYRTLLALMERQGWVVPRDQLQRAVYRDAQGVESNTIAVYVHQLRRKLGEQLITTLPGHGYRLGPAR